MKKLLFILCACAALFSCTKIQETDQKNEIRVNVRVTRSDDFAATKATVKSKWAYGDMIYLFFQNENDFIELTYDRSARGWTAQIQGELSFSDLASLSLGKMTAVYLPYCNDASLSVRISGNKRVFVKGEEDLEYCGYFLFAEDVSYSLAEGVLDADINLTTPVLSGNDQLVHFDVTGFTSGHKYELYQDHLKRLTFTGVSTSGKVTMTVKDMGKAIPGYEDKTSGKKPILSFSGVLDGSVAGTATDFQFSVNDITDCVLYTRDAGEKTITGTLYAGLGDISAPAVWTAMEYVDMGTRDEDGKRVMWARRNIGATAEKGEGSYGLYFAFGQTRGYALLGTFGNYTGIEDDHDFYEAWDLSYEIEDTWPEKLMPEYDAAHVNLKGLWHMPDISDFKDLVNNTIGAGEEGKRIMDTETPESGMTFISKINGAELFFPAANSLASPEDTYRLSIIGSGGDYWSRTPSYAETTAYALLFYEDYAHDYTGENYWGNPIRAVFTID